jgi:putative redox protein
VAGHHQLAADEGVGLGGKDTGPAPYELLCSAFGACTAITLRMYAERKGWPLRGLHVFERKGKEGTIARVLSFEGELDNDQRARLADIAERTPVTLTLKARCRDHHDRRLIANGRAGEQWSLRFRAAADLSIGSPPGDLQDGKLACAHVRRVLRQGPDFSV